MYVYVVLHLLLFQYLKFMALAHIFNESTLACNNKYKYIFNTFTTVIDSQLMQLRTINLQNVNQRK